MMRQTLLLAILFFLTNTEYSNAQQELDSLKTVVITSADDLEKIMIYRRMGLLNEPINFDTALYYYDRAMQLSVQNNWVLEQAKTQANIGFAYQYSLGSDSSLVYLLKGLELYKEIDDQAGILDSYYNLGSFAGAFEQHTQAIAYYKQAVPIGKALKNEERLGMIYNNLGLLCEYSGKYLQAIEYQIESLKIKEQIGDPTVGYSYANIGLNYNALGNSKMAIEYFHKSLNNNKSQSKAAEATCYNGIGDAYFNDKDLKQALDYYQKAFERYTDLNQAAGITRYYVKTGSIFFVQNNFLQANQAFLKALETYPENGGVRLLISINSNLASLYFTWANTQNPVNTAQLQKAKTYAEQTYILAKNLQVLDNISESSKTLYLTNTALGNTKEALYYADVYIRTNDSLLSKEKIKAINEIQTKYETEKKELEINLLSKENDLKAVKLSEGTALQSQQQLYIIFLVVGVLVTVIFLVLSYLFYLQKNKTNKELLAKNSIISKQNEEKEILLKEIHHRVKNNLQIISSLLDLQNKGIDDLKASAAIEDGQSRIKSMALIHHKLYQNEDIVSINFKEYTQQLLNQILSIATNISPKQIINIPENMEFDIDTAIPLGLILNELLTNACKYAFKGTDSDKIEISLTKNTIGDYQLEVKDNGAGLPADFEFKKSRSLGLRLVRRLSKQLFGSADYSNQNGAHFVVTFKDSLSRKKIA